MNDQEPEGIESIGIVPVCVICGSERVARDAWACWNRDAGFWELEQAFDQTHCHQCEVETSLKWVRPEPGPNGRIRELNDLLRATAQGNGEILITPGISDQGNEYISKVAAAVQTFDTFTEENDPYGEHDFGAVEVEGQKVFWKIDYYNPTKTAGSDDPANPNVTHRVLTIMLAEEY